MLGEEVFFLLKHPEPVYGRVVEREVVIWKGGMPVMEPGGEVVGDEARGSGDRSIRKAQRLHVEVGGRLRTEFLNDGAELFFF